MTEFWKTVSGFPSYEVSTWGKVRRVTAGPSTHAGRLLKLRSNPKGYVIVALYANNKRHMVTVHKLVAAAFMGARPEGSQVNHKDGDKANNSVGNLEYVTPRDNVSHAMKAGLCPNTAARSKQAAVKLNADKVRAMLALEHKQSQRAIARQFGVHFATVNSIFRGRLWSHVTGRSVLK